MCNGQKLTTVGYYFKFGTRLNTMNTLFLKPMIAMMLLTFLVWLSLYAKRLPYLLKHQIAPQSVATPEQMTAMLPAHIHYPANNLRNLSELPVLFYALCLIATYLNVQSGSLQFLAWSFVILRGLHSIIHCSYNCVTHRFVFYMLSSLVLWVFLISVAYHIWKI